MRKSFSAEFSRPTYSRVIHDDIFIFIYFCRIIHLVDKMTTLLQGGKTTGFEYGLRHGILPHASDTNIETFRRETFYDLNIVQNFT